MAEHRDEDSPRVVKERRKGTALTFVALGLLVLLALLALFGGNFLPADPVEKTDVKVEVDPESGVEKSE